MKAKVLNIIDKKTFKASFFIRKRHPRYDKYVCSKRACLVSYSGQSLFIGQTVEIASSSPVSKRKKWSLKIN